MGRVVMLSSLLIWGFFAAPTAVTAMDNLDVVYQWNLMDFNFTSADDRDDAIRSGRFIPENNVPMGIEVADGRLFVSLPRWRQGVAATLAYVYLNETDSSPKLNPYPNWESHDIDTNNSSPSLIVSPFRTRADRCGHLWVLDSGQINILESNITRTVIPPTLTIFNLKDDTVARRYEIPENVYVKNVSFFATISVDDHDCSNMYAYLADISTPGLAVYSWKDNDSWFVKHLYFNIDPTAGDFYISGINVHWKDGIFGTALSAVKPDGFSDLYFHPMISTDEFVVSTKILNDKNLSKNSFHEFKRLGSRGPKGQSSVSFLDQKTGVLFYALISLNAIACWKTSNPKYTMQSQGRIIMNNVTMSFPSDIKVDGDDNLWVLSNRLPIFMYSKLSGNETNFRVLSASVKDAINGTACDERVIVPSDVVAKMKDHLVKTNKSISNQNPKIRNVPDNSSNKQFQFNFAQILLIATIYLFVH